MEGFLQNKDAGLSKMNDGNFEQAIPDFTQVIDNLKPTNDDEAVLKAVCFLDRSACYIYMQKYEDALNDANAVIKLYNEMRPEQEQQKYDEQKIVNDKLIIPLSLAYVRRGQVYESQSRFLDALNEYSVSTTLKFDGEGQTGLKSVLAHIGVPEIDQHDPELEFFAAILANLLSEANVLTALTNLMTFVSEGKPDDKWIGKINNTGCCRVLYGVMQLYMDHEMIVVGCVTSLRLLAERGAVDAFNGFLVLRVACEHWKRSNSVIPDILRLLVMSPPQLLPYLARADYIPVCIEAFDLELKDEEYDYIFYLLFQLAETESQLVQLGAEGAVDKALERKSRNALIFLSKACQLKDNVKIVERENGIDWVIEMIQSNLEDKRVLSAAAIILAQSFMAAAENKEQGSPDAIPEDKLKARGQKTFELLFPIATKQSKEAELVSNIFAALAASLEYAVDYAREQRVVQAASAILTMNSADEGCAQNIVSLFFACTLCGMLDDLKNTRSAIPTLINTLKDHSTNLLLVERAVAVICEVDHPKKKEFYDAAIKQQPESPILKKYESLFEEKKE